MDGRFNLIAVPTLVTIMVSHGFIGYHRWADAPDAVAFLRNYHRHRFGVKAVFGVTHDDRQLEFFLVQEQLRQVCTEGFENRQFEASCEMIAKAIASALLGEGMPVLSVTVDEDGENSATVSLMPVQGVTAQTMRVAVPIGSGLDNYGPSDFPTMGEG